ncbi:DUF5813 family protein [Halobellus ordinarius]|uniref:DUF5813 family protein n=1 Tax=Halobellus ordinarius TaxID=3075120 RepID=UPI0028805AB8|nr:DUF5813 family protein [Halobellus sp. ZY16]
MTESDGDDALARAERAAGSHDSIERREDHYAVTTTAFEGEIELGSDESAAVVSLTVRVPTLDAVTEDRVAPVVEDGWFDTFALRTEDVDSAVAGSDPAVDVDRAADSVIVRITLTGLDARRAVDDAVAAVEYVEGTYVQGVIPGYQYTEPVTGLIEQAADAAGGSPGGTPL